MKQLLVMVLATLTLSFANAHTMDHGHGPDHGGHHDNEPVTYDPSCPIHFAQQNVCADIHFLQAPKVGVSSDFHVVFYRLNTDGSKTTVATENVMVDLWMNMGSHSHGAPPLTHHQHSESSWMLTDVYFVMAGKWQIRVHLNGEQGILPVMAQP